MANHYDVPSWAGRAPTGHHLDVLKDDKLIQKLMIDEKKCYLFGRNPHLNDFCIDHGSCSRVHAALVYHKNLNISYLVDLGSTHGTFIGTLQIEAHKPTQLQMNSTFHFGASTRYYTLRERPSAGSRSNIMEDIPLNESAEGALLGLPESQTELDNLTEYNTAHNRRISMLGITDDVNTKKSGTKSKRKRRGVTFNEEEIIINPEDIDPAVGRFRNLIQTTVLPTKRMRYENNPIGMATGLSSGNSGSGTSGGGGVGGHGSGGAVGGSNSIDNSMKHLHPSVYHHHQHLYQDLPPTSSDHDIHRYGGSGANGTGIGGSGGNANNSGHFSNEMDLSNMSSKFGIMLPNPAPEVAPAIFEEEPIKIDRNIMSTTVGVGNTSGISSSSMATQLSSSASSSSAPGGGNYNDDNMYGTTKNMSGSSSGGMDDQTLNNSDNSDEPRKKKYAKEAWPGRKPLLSTF